MRRPSIVSPSSCHILMALTVALLSAVAGASSAGSAQSPRTNAEGAGDEEARVEKGRTEQPGAEEREHDTGEEAKPRAADTLPVYEAVVTASRSPQRRGEVPATVIVISRDEIEQSPALVTDDLLRSIPSVGLFRRSSSLSAHPTSQGLNLRAVGPSAVSRGLVLLDGVPMNEPFGGWLYWRSLPTLGIQRIEIVPGGASALYGNYALGGVVQLVSRPIRTTGLEAQLAAGTLDTYAGALRGTLKVGDLGLSLEAEGLSTGGFSVVAPWDAGAIDGRAPSQHLAVNARAEYEAGPASLSARLGHFVEEQSGGTQFTEATVRVTDLALRGALDLFAAGRLEATLFGRLQRFAHVRARVGDARDVETRSSTQRVPTNDQGAGLVWFAPAIEAGGTHRISVGVDARRNEGVSLEEVFPASTAPGALVEREAGGEQQFYGLFVEDVLTPVSGWQVAGALRADLWRNLGGHRTTTRQNGDEHEETIPDRLALSLNPRLGVLHRPIEALALRASVWRGFRAPTLNELYRPFQVGTILTAANSELEPESVWGGELGAELNPSEAVRAVVTGFWNETFDSVSNVTLDTPLEGAQRQRQNLGRARIRGVELTLEGELADRWSLLGAYSFVDARVLEVPSQPELVGLLLPQAPQHRATTSVRFSDRDLFDLTLQARWLGPQFEDDRNERELGGYVLVDAYVSRHLTRGVHLFAAVENLFDRTYLVGRAGVDTIGAPFTVRAGLKVRL